MENRINTCTIKEFNNLLYEFKNIKFKRDNYSLKDGQTNCVGFITYLFSDFSYLVEFDKMKKNNYCYLERKEVPDNFSIVLFMESLDEVYQHVGIFFDGKVYSMGLKGIQSTDVNILKKIYKDLRFFDIIRIKKEGLNE